MFTTAHIWLNLPRKKYINISAITFWTLFHDLILGLAFVQQKRSISHRSISEKLIAF